jgi:A/G-specific adenine glycosylase
MTEFASRLLTWFDEHGRTDLPWQQSRNAYGIWVSEIMLQQTQVQTVIPYYERFMQSFPDIEALAGASSDAVLRQWSGLGYYARARNLHKAARRIRDEFDGQFPTSFDDVVGLPGVGRSTAAAILSLACEQRHAILDGNVKRVIARHAAIAGWPGSSKVQKALWAVAERHTPDDRVAAYTQAIMDLGATLCTRSRPACETCPVSADCIARESATIDHYPGRKPKREKPLKQTTMVLAVADHAVYLERRPAAGIWGGLWSFPEVGHDEVLQYCERLAAAPVADHEEWQAMRHSFSHYDLDIKPVVVRFETARTMVADGNNAVWYSLHAPPPGGIAAPVQKLIDSLRMFDNVANY